MTASVSPSQLSVSVVIPARDEANSLGSLIPQIRKSLEGYPHEIVVVDDGSRDSTREIALSQGALVVTHPKNQGKGAAMKTGVKNARGDIIVFLDGDGAHDPQDIWAVVAPIREGRAELTIGSRSLPGARVVSPPLARRLSNSFSSIVISATISFLLPLATVLHSLFFRGNPLSRAKTPEPQGGNPGLRAIGPNPLPQTYRLITGRVKRITDCTSGFRAIAKEAWNRLELNSLGFEIETEMTYEAARNGLAIAEAPISCHWDSQHSRLFILRDGVKTLKLLGGKLIRDMGRR